MSDVAIILVALYCMVAIGTFLGALRTYVINEYALDWINVTVSLVTAIFWPVFFAIMKARSFDDKSF